jgi:hypothetical protein
MNFEPAFFTSFAMEPSSLPIYSPTIKGLELKWNNSEIGAIDESIVFYRKEYNDDLLYVWESQNSKLQLTPIRVLKYKDDIPFIIEEFKSIFNIPVTGKHKATLKEQECIITRYVNDVPYETYFETHSISSISDSLKKSIQCLYIFRYILCLNCNYENRIEIRQPTIYDVFPISCREVKFSLFSDDNACRLPNNVVRDWFDNDHYKVIEIAKEMIKDFDITMLKFKMGDIIRKYKNGKYIHWVNTIYDRLCLVKNI